MVIGLYFLAIVLAVLTINIWSKEEVEESTLLSISAGGAGLVAIGLFGWGFVLFSWYIPLAALVVGIFAGTSGAMLARRGGAEVSVAVVCAAASVVVGAAVAYLSNP